MFYTLKEAQIIAELWRNHYNTLKRVRRFGLPPASPTGYRPDRTKVGHALTFKLDQVIGADQCHSMAPLLTSQTIHHRRKVLINARLKVLKQQLKLFFDTLEYTDT